MFKGSVVKSQNMDIKWEVAMLCPIICVGKETGTSWQDAVHTKLLGCAKICLP